MAQIIRICSIIIFISVFFLGLKKTYPNSVKNNIYGNYLSWNFARNTGDTGLLKNFFPNIDLNKVEYSVLEEVFFEAVFFNDWEEAKKIGTQIFKKDEYSFLVNLLSFSDFFLENKKTKSLSFLKKVNLSEFDLNFIRVLLLWSSYNQSSEKFDLELDEQCIPLICLHNGLFNIFIKKYDEGFFYFDKIKKNKLNSFRVSELLLYYYLDNKNKKAAEEIIQFINEQNLNFGNLNVDDFYLRKKTLNPVLTPKDGLAEVFYNISSWYFTKNLYKYAAFFGEISLKFRPNFSAMRLLLVGIYEKLNYLELALDRMNNLDRNNIYFYKFLKMKLSIFDQLEMKKEAIEELKNLTKLYPNNPKIIVLLADRLRANKSFVEAIKHYSDLLKLTNKSERWGIFYSRGIAYEQSGQWKEGEKDLLTALELNPKDPYILNYLGYSWLDRNKNIKKALGLLETAVEIEPGDAYIVDSLGWAYYLSGSLEKSVFYLEKAVSLLPNDATLNDHLGDAYWKIGRKKEAISQWKRVLIFDPNFKKKEIIKKKITNGL